MRRFFPNPTSGRNGVFFVFYPFGAVSVTYPSRCDRADFAFREESDMSRAEPFRKRKNGEKGAVLNNSPGGSGILLKNTKEDSKTKETKDTKKENTPVFRNIKFLVSITYIFVGYRF